MTAALSSNASTPCAGTLQGLENFLEESMGVSWVYFPAHPLGHGLDLSFPRLHIRLSPAPVNQISTRSPRFITTGGLLLLLPGESNQTSPSAMLRRCREKHQCIFADGQKASSGPQELFPAARTKHWDTGEAAGARTKMLVWEPSCHSLPFSSPLSSSSPLPIL